MRIARDDGLLAVLRNRDYRLLIAAFTVSFAGSWAYNVALMVLVWDETHSPAWMGAATIGRFLPSMLFGPYGGVVAERFERVRLMVTLDVASATINVGFTIVAVTHAHVVLAIALGALSATVQTAYQPAATALTPQTVPESQLAAANTLRNTVDNLAVIVGPAVGGLLLVVGPPALAFLVNAGTFVWSAVVTSRISVRSRPVDVTDDGRSGAAEQMLVGIQTILQSSSATVLCTFGLATSFVYGFDTVQFVLLSQHRLGTGANGVSYLLAGLGFGGVLAAGVVNRISAWPRLGSAILLGMLVFCLPTLALLVVHSPTTAFGIEALRGAGTLAVDVLTVTAMQRVLPEDKLARVFGAYFTGVVGSIALGAAAVPPLLHATSLNGTIWFAGLGIPVVCMLGWPALQRIDRTNLAHVAELEPRVAALARAGILAKASRTLLEALASTATELEVAPGRDVVIEGEVADAFFVIEQGAVSVHSHGSSGGRALREERQMAVLGTGDYFGEVGLLEKIPRTATVSTTASSRFLRVDAEHFFDAMSAGSVSSAFIECARQRHATTAQLTRATGPMPGSAAHATADPAT